MNVKLSPKTLVGTLHNQNKGAFDWGWQGLLAYGCQSLVAVLDPKSLQVVQVLDRHNNYVVKVKWSKENYHHDLSTPYTLRLASADHYGQIVIWDVTHGLVRSDFSDGSKPIQDMEWLSTDGSHDLLAVIHPSYSLVLWNAETGQKLWKKTYTDVIINMAFDPFDNQNVTFLGQDFILFVDDFSVAKVPSGNGKKFYISSPAMSNTSSAGDLKTPENMSKNKLARRMGLSRLLQLDGDQTKHRGQPEEEAITLNECIQLAYHRMHRNHIILVYSREILVLDLDINQTVATITLERASSPLIQMIPCQLRDAMFLLHENGSITMRVRRRGMASGLNGADQGFGSQDELSSVASYDMMYDTRCQSDAVRITKHSRVFGMVANPVSETSVALIVSDSRVLVWELKTIDYQDNMAVLSSSQTLQSPLYTPGFTTTSSADQPQFDFNEMASDTLPLTCPLPYPKYTLSDLIEHTQQFVQENKHEGCRHGVLLKFLLTGMINGVAPPPLVIRMCPPLTTKNWQNYQPMLALGTSTGLVQVYNLSSGQLWREYSVHSCQVRGIEWVSLQSFLSFGYPANSSSGLVKNELVLVNLQTGKCTKYREHKDEESPIEMIRVSHLRQYFVVTFKDKPFELWDLRQRSLLREMPRNFPHVTAVEWSPSHNMKSLKKKQDSVTSSNSQTDTTQHSEALIRQKHDSGKSVPPNVTVKEHFVFTDTDGQLYHFMVEGNVIKDGSRIPPDSNMGSITCIAWKGDTMVLGDVDGNLNMWDLKARVSKTVPTHKGWIKKIKFAPGRGNHKLLVLYSDGLAIWDTKEAEIVSSVRCPRELPKISDAEWAASDKPVVSTLDGCVRMFDLKLKVAMAPIEDLQLPDLLFCPHMLVPKAAMILKCLLQHQHWRPAFDYRMTDLPSSCKDLEQSINDHLDTMEPELKNYLPRCRFGTAERCLLVARLFGDESDVHFWTVALHYLRAEKAQPMAPKTDSLQSPLEMGDLFVPSPSASNPKLDGVDLLNLDEFSVKRPKEQETRWHFIQDKPLETSFDILMDSHSFQKHQLDRTSLHDSKRASYNNTRQCAENLILLGQADRAVQLLLETDADSDEFYIDCLRACLVASIRSSGASQSTIKLVATNLIASSKLSEGVQLLCLIDKGLDACRYLQTYGMWYKAAWLAKASLSYSECSEVMKRWVDHLCTPNVNQKSKAVLILLSLGQFYKVVEMLYGMHQFDRAALFLESCLEFKLIQRTDESSPLIDAVFLEYARLMCSLQLSSAARYYCTQAGQKGALFAKEVDIIFSGGDDASTKTEQDV